MRTGRLGFQKLVLATELAVILGGLLAFGIGHSWIEQPELGDALDEIGTLASGLADEGGRLLKELTADGDDAAN
ncbi:hypothetical protein [Limibacillus sp. MBR-115]|uniref:hypothetical protein n=1 Tax=Limibacillus sp. MBR-115 TaxID=3156465 RepID=UPI003398585E